VSRLTQTLVGTGYLQVEPRTRAYRLAPAVLSLAHAMRTGSTALAIAAPHMRDLAQAERVNVGLAAPDRDEMVYLESIRYNRRPSLRRVVSGLRRPRRTHWAELEPALTAAIHEFEEKGLLCRRLVNPAAQAELRILHNAGHIVCSFPRTGTSGPTCVQMVTALGARR
jgi:hypothetical protein